ncbi:MAG: metal-dependent hydrolase [Candidatus Micrarchaeota archaeon]|nr:metal-dependent hydrolase [Candidatus Micrarchaeota archaeon]
MRWGAHLLFGVLCSFAAGKALGLPDSQLAPFCAISAFFSLLPDIDAKQSKISGLARGAIALAGILASFALSEGKAERFAFLVLVLFAAIWALEEIARPRHRGITHSLLFAAACVAAVFAVAGEIPAIAAGIGIMSHLLADGVASKPF